MSGCHDTERIIFPIVVSFQDHYQRFHHRYRRPTVELSGSDNRTTSSENRFRAPLCIIGFSDHVSNIHTHLSSSRLSIIGNEKQIPNHVNRSHLTCHRILISWSRRLSRTRHELPSNCCRNGFHRSFIFSCFYSDF